MKEEVLAREKLSALKLLLDSTTDIGLKVREIVIIMLVMKLFVKNLKIVFVEEFYHNDLLLIFLPFFLIFSPFFFFIFFILVASIRAP